MCAATPNSDLQSSIVVCGEQELQHWVEQRTFSGVISIGDANRTVPPCLQRQGFSILRLCFQDTFEVNHPNGPKDHHLRALLQFGEQIRHAHSPLLIHCLRGHSRAAAVALVLLADWMGEGREREAVVTHEHIIGPPKGCLNLQIIKIGDRIMQRNGQLISAYLRHASA